MKKWVFLACLLAPLAHGQNAAISGFCTQGASQALLSGLLSTNYQQGIVPSCLVTVYYSGTTNIVPIYSNSGGTTLGNPFTASNLGQWTFFAATGSFVDIVLSGGTCPNCYQTPITITGVPVSGGFIPGTAIQPSKLNSTFLVDGTHNPSGGVAIQACLDIAATQLQNHLNGVSGGVQDPGCEFWFSTGNTAAENAMGGPWDFEIPCDDVGGVYTCYGPTTTSNSQCSLLQHTSCNFIGNAFKLAEGNYPFSGSFTLSSFQSFYGDGPGNANGVHGTTLTCPTNGTPCFVQGLNTVANNITWKDFSFVCPASSFQSAVWLNYASVQSGYLQQPTWTNLNFNGCNGDTVHLNGGSNSARNPVQQGGFQDWTLYRPAGGGFGVYIGGNGGSDKFERVNVSTQPIAGTPNNDTTGPFAATDFYLGNSSWPESITFSTYTITSGSPYNTFTATGTGPMPINAGYLLSFASTPTSWTNPDGATWTSSPWTSSPANTSPANLIGVLNGSNVQAATVSTSPATCPGASCGQVNFTITWPTSQATASATPDTAVASTLAPYYGQVAISGSISCTSGTCTMPFTSTNVPLPGSPNGSSSLLYMNGFNSTGSGNSSLNGCVFTLTSTATYTGPYPGAPSLIASGYFPGTAGSMTGTLSGSGCTTLTWSGTDTATGYVETLNASPYKTSFDGGIYEDGSLLFWVNGISDVDWNFTHHEGSTGCTNGWMFSKAFTANQEANFNGTIILGNVGVHTSNCFLWQSQYTQNPFQLNRNNVQYQHPVNEVVGPVSNVGQTFRNQGNNPGGAPGIISGVTPSFTIPTSNSTAAQFTASISGNVMTVTAVSSGTIALNNLLWSTSTALISNTVVTAFGTGTGGTGTYTLNNFQTVGSETIYGATPPIVTQGVIDTTGTTLQFQVTGSNSQPLCGLVRYTNPDEMWTMTFTAAGTIEDSSVTANCGLSTGATGIAFSLASLGVSTLTVPINAVVTGFYSDVTNKEVVIACSTCVLAPASFFPAKLLSPYVSTTGTWTTASAVISVASGTGISIGQLVTATGISAGTYVTGVSGTSVTLNQVPSNNETTQAVTFTTYALNPTSATVVYSLEIPANTLTSTSALDMTLAYAGCTGSGAPFQCTTANTGTCTPSVTIGTTAGGGGFALSSSTAITAAKPGVDKIHLQWEGSNSSESGSHFIVANTTATSALNPVVSTQSVASNLWVTVTMTDASGASTDQCYLYQADLTTH